MTDKFLTNVANDYPIFAALAGQDFVALERHLAVGLSPNVVNTRGDIPLLTALLTGNEPKFIEALLEHGANANIYTPHSRIDPLTIGICRKLPLRLIQRMVNNGADPNFVAYNGAGDSPLVLAVSAGNKKLADFLLAAGAHANEGAAGAPVYKIPFLFAFRREAWALCDLLLTYGADPTIKDSAGQDAQGYAQATGHRGALKYIKRVLDKYLARDSSCVNE